MHLPQKPPPSPHKMPRTCTSSTHHRQTNRGLLWRFLHGMLLPKGHRPCLRTAGRGNHTGLSVSPFTAIHFFPYHHLFTEYARCASGEHEPTTSFGLCGIICAIFLFPIGLIFLWYAIIYGFQVASALMLYSIDSEQKCARCGLRLPS
jgi:hypothetical protein